MSLNIKNPVIEADIRKLARAKRGSLTDAVGTAVRKELDSLKSSRPHQTAEDLLKATEEWRKQFGVEVGGLGSDHSWLYDKDGLPA